jgi:hypothetical protein
MTQFNRGETWRLDTEPEFLHAILKRCFVGVIASKLRPAISRSLTPSHTLSLMLMLFF